MKLVYLSTMKEVKIDDIIDLGEGEMVEVMHFRKPYKPSSEGKVSTRTVNSNRRRQYYTSVIGAIWIEREDRGEGV